MTYQRTGQPGWRQRLLCRVFGHLPPVRVAGIYAGLTVAAVICPRCHRIAERAVGKRAAKRLLGRLR